LKVPAAVGVPEIVIVFDAQEAVTPAGSPVAVPMPVAPVVERVMFVSGVLIHNVGLDDAAPTVLIALALTVMVPDALTAAPHPPVSGML
jgi:hypothetical protein